MVGDHLVELLRRQVVRHRDVVERVAEHEVVALVRRALLERQAGVVVVDLDLRRVLQAEVLTRATSVTSGSISATTESALVVRGQVPRERVRPAADLERDRSLLPFGTLASVTCW